MEPATDQSGGSGGAMRRWGPIIAIVVVAAIVAALVVMGGDDDEASDDGGDGGNGEQATEVTTADGEPIFPFSWADGEASGLTDELEWGERCDTETGTHAIPVVGAQPCYLPFEGDNGGATARGRDRRQHQDRRVPRPRHRPGDQLRHRRDPGGRRQRRHPGHPRQPDRRSTRPTTRPTAAASRSSTT